MKRFRPKRPNPQPTARGQPELSALIESPAVIDAFC